MCALVKESREEDQEDSEKEDEYCRVMRNLALTSTKKDESQRHNLFCTRCHIGDQVCEVIID